VVSEVASYSKLSKNRIGENLDPRLQKPVSKAQILSCRSEKILLNFFISLSLIGWSTPLYYTQIINFTIYLIINPLIPLSLTAMPWGGWGVKPVEGEQLRSERLLIPL
jgi:hypothetical protein